MSLYSLILIYRNFQKNKASFLINIVGLSTGLASALLIYLWVNDEISIDKFHEQDSQLFQVMHNISTPDGIMTIENTQGLLAKSLAEEMPEVKHATSIFPAKKESRGQGTISIGDTHLKASGPFVERNYFNFFSYKLVEGDKNQVLSDKYSVVISDQLALRLFHNMENIIGEVVEWEHGNFSGLYTVTGIFEKPPNNSTAQFDLLFNYELYFEKYASNLENWENSNPYTYVILNEGTDIDKFNDKIKYFVKSKFKDDKGTLFLQRYSDRYLYSHYENGVQVGGRIVYVKLFTLIALFLLTIAGINFMNLSTAKASRRMKEIGIKKAMGSDRKALISQFLGESILMTFISLVIALILVHCCFHSSTQLQESISTWFSLLILCCQL